LGRINQSVATSLQQGFSNNTNREGKVKLYISSSSMAVFITEYPQFLTATNLEWKKLLQQDKYKDIIVRSMRFLAKQNRVLIYGFVIMPNHLHLI
jgi:hypothetical protein